MTMLAKRETLHQIIDDLSEHQLFELAQYIEFLLSKAQQSTSSYDLWVFTEEEEPDTLENELPRDLSEVIQLIKNTPPDADSVTYPTKTWAEYAAEASPREASLDVAAWNDAWDNIEAEMEANSLAHEELERREQ